MICNTIGLTADSFETLYVHGGAEVPEVYGSINYAHPIFYSLKTLTGATSYSFKGYPSPLKSYEIGGNMVQNGTPTPTAPIYPQECGDRTVNLWNPSLPEIKRIFEIEPGKMYKAAKNPPLTGRIDLTIYDADMNIITSNYAALWSGISLGGYSGQKYAEVSLTYGSGTQNPEKYVYFGEGTGNNNIGADIPYGYQIPITCGGETKNIYLTEPLLKIGNYADVVNSDGTVTRRIRKRVLTGEETIDENAGRYIVRAGLSSSVNYIGKCTHFVNKSTGTVAWFDNKFSIESVNIFFGVLEMFDSIAAFRQLLTDSYAAGNPVTVWYVLTTPTTETITSPAVIPITGSNTLSIDTTLAPSSVSITGHVKPTSG